MGPTNMPMATMFKLQKKIAKELGEKPLIVKNILEWINSRLTSGKIDMIIAGMSPTEEKEKKLPFLTVTIPPEPVVLVKKMERMPKPKLDDFKGLKSPPNKEFTSTIWFRNSRELNKKLQWGILLKCAKPSKSGVIDGYISERPEALTAEAANSSFKMIQFKKRLEVGKEDASIAIGMQKDDQRMAKVNEAISKISSQDQVS